MIAPSDHPQYRGIRRYRDHSDGRRHANIQVKASLKRVNFFPMPAVERVRAGPRDWYVLLRWLPKELRFEGFMLSGRQAREEVESITSRSNAELLPAPARNSFPPSMWGHRPRQKRNCGGDGG